MCSSCRLSEAVATRSHTVIAAAVGQETLLHHTYEVGLPSPHRDASAIPGLRDVAATVFLNASHPTIAQEAVPLIVHGDGNCLFRAASRRLYGTEQQHDLLRLMTSLEIASHVECYDPSLDYFVNLVRNDRIFIPDFFDTLGAVCTLGQYWEILHMYTH